VYQKFEVAPSPHPSLNCPSEEGCHSFNRWIKMAEIIPWSEFEAECAENFTTLMGAPAKSFRMALGALIIKEKLGIS
jgi:IS5 family transposase